MVEVFSEKDWVEKTERRQKKRISGNISAKWPFIKYRRGLLVYICLKLKENHLLMKRYLGVQNKQQVYCKSLELEKGKETIRVNEKTHI